MTVFMNKCGEKKKFVKFYMFTQIVKHFTDTSDFQTLVWDMQNSSEGLPEKSQTVFSYLSKFVLMYVVFLYFGIYVKYPLFLSDFNKTLIFWTEFRKKNSQISNFMKIRPVGTEDLCHAEDGRTDSQTDMTNLIVAFRSLV